MVHLLLAVIYLSFISLGLPDALLGAAWPAIYGPFGVPVSCAGILSMIIALGTVVSSLLSDRLTRRFGPGRVTAVSTAATAAAMLGFSVSNSFRALCLWAVPYGLGAGSVDASLNNYVALHYASRHTIWLHCMWGVGASMGPSIMSAALTGGYGWHIGYRAVGLLQAVLTAALFLSLPLWRRQTAPGGGEEAPAAPALSLGEILRLPGAPAAMTVFFCYCAVEQTIGLWASSYLVLHLGLSSEAAAGFAGLFFLGVTAGRGASGFLTLRLSDVQMVRLGLSLLTAGLAVLLLPLGGPFPLAGLLLAGLGCAPIYPCLIHATPSHFGPERSQAVIGVQMASAYVGTCLMPFLFGLAANHLSVALFPVYLAALLLAMALAYRRLVRSAGENAGK